MVVLPVPASPTSSAMPVRAVRPYSSVVSASRWRGGHQQEARVRRQLERALAKAVEGFVHQGVPLSRPRRHNETTARPAMVSTVAATDATTTRRRRPRSAIRRHDRDRGEHRQHQRPQDLVFAPQRRVAILQEGGEPDAEHQPERGADQRDLQAVGAERLLRQPRRIEDLELLADLLPFEVGRDLRFFLLREQARVALLQRLVVAHQIGQLRLVSGHRLDAALIVGDLLPQAGDVRFLGRDLTIELLDFGLELTRTRLANRLRGVQRLLPSASPPGAASCASCSHLALELARSAASWR